MDSKQISFTPREAIYNAVYWGLASSVSMHHSLPLHIINKPSGRINIKQQVHRKNITWKWTSFYILDLNAVYNENKLHLTFSIADSCPPPLIALCASLARLLCFALLCLLCSASFCSTFACSVGPYLARLLLCFVLWLDSAFLHVAEFCSARVCSAAQCSLPDALVINSFDANQFADITFSYHTCVAYWYKLKASWFSNQS